MAGSAAQARPHRPVLQAIGLGARELQAYLRMREQRRSTPSPAPAGTDTLARFRGEIGFFLVLVNGWMLAGGGLGAVIGTRRVDLAVHMIGGRGLFIVRAVPILVASCMTLLA